VLGLALTLTGSVTFGEDRFDIRIYNDTADEIVVTVLDMNAGSPDRSLHVKSSMDLTGLPRRPHRASEATAT
jgi:hypothetical protein